MNTLSYFKDKQGRQYGMSFEGSFLAVISKIYVELQKGSLYMRTLSVNDKNGHKQDITGQVRSMLNRKQGRVH